MILLILLPVIKIRETQPLHWHGEEESGPCSIHVGIRQRNADLHQEHKQKTHYLTTNHIHKNWLE